MAQDFPPPTQTFHPKTQEKHTPELPPHLPGKWEVKISALPKAFRGTMSFFFPRCDRLHRALNKVTGSIARLGGSRQGFMGGTGRG